MVVVNYLQVAPAEPRAEPEATPDQQICQLDGLMAQDLSGRPYLGWNVDIPTERIGTFDTQLAEHFFCSLANTGVQMLLHS